MLLREQRAALLVVTWCYRTVSTAALCDVAGVPSLDLTLHCYTCSYDVRDKESNKLCVTEPWNLTSSVRRCPIHFKFCIIVRVEAKESGEVTSFLRRCEENPEPDSDVDSMTIVSHYRSCMTDLCNKGDGLNYIDDGHEEECPAILVPDRDSVAALSPAVGLIFISFIFSVSEPVTGFLTCKQIKFSGLMLLPPSLL